MGTEAEGAPLLLLLVPACSCADELLGTGPRLLPSVLAAQQGTLVAHHECSWLETSSSLYCSQ